MSVANFLTNNNKSYQNLKISDLECNNLEVANINYNNNNSSLAIDFGSLLNGTGTMNQKQGKMLLQNVAVIPVNSQAILTITFSNFTIDAANPFILLTGGPSTPLGLEKEVALSCHNLTSTGMIISISNITTGNTTLTDMSLSYMIIEQK